METSKKQEPVNKEILKRSIAEKNKILKDNKIVKK